MRLRDTSDARRAERSLRRIPALTFVLLCVGLGGGWSWTVAGARSSDAERDRVLADQTGLRVGDWVNVRIALLRSVENLVANGLLDPSTEWTPRIAELIAPLGGLQAVNWIAPDGTIAAIAPIPTNEAALGQRVLEHPVVGPEVRAAIDGDRLRASRPVDLYQGGRGFTVYLPVRDAAGALLGVVNGVFRSDRLEQECLAEVARTRGVALDDEGVPVVAGGGGIGASAVVTARVAVADRSWQLRLSASPSQPDAIALLVLALGLGLIGAVTWLLHLALARQAEATEAHAARAEMAARLRSAERLEAMGHLAGGVAHDFNNLLTVIQGHADLIHAHLAPRDSRSLEPREREDLEESVGAIRDAAARAAGVTGQLLAFARREPVTTGSVEVAGHVTSLAPMLRNLATEGVSLAVEVPAEPVWAACPATVLDRALVNLVANAREAVKHQGAIAIRVTATPSDVTITVADDGHGMPPEVVRRAFEPFYTTRATGSGLGLATVYGLVTQRGGTIDVSSAVGEGTCFTIVLPRSDAPDHAHVIEAAAPHTPDAAIRAILVEDDAAVRRTLERALEGAGISVTTFPDAQSAIAAEPEGDVLVTDLVLPDGDGVEVAQALRKGRPELPVIIISGYADHPGSVDDTLSSGARFLAKPFQVSALIGTIRDVLGRPPS